MTPQRIGLLFGSFNPIHTGHLILANYLATRTDLDAVWLIVSPQSPFKVGQELLPEQLRYELVQLAIADNPRLRALDVEFRLPRPSYTMATLDELSRQYPSHTFVLLMGQDNVAGLPRWKEATRLLAQYSVYVYPRPGSEALPTPLPSYLRVVSAPLLDISATFIRQSLQAGHSIRYLVPASVEQVLLATNFWPPAQPASAD